jgi:hypothetical protein
MPTPALSKAAVNRKAHRILSKLVLLLAVLAVISTVLATTSRDVILQVLSQTELVPVQNNQATKNNSNNRAAIVHEPYGYVSIKDDTGKAGFLRYLSHASFYEYRLPRAFLKVSQHKEELTLEESEELQFRAGLRKRPQGWDPSSSEQRNVFLDEPYRDKTIDRLFKRSHRKINTSLVVGILSLLGLVILGGRLHITNHTTACSNRPRIWVLKVASLLPIWNGCLTRYHGKIPTVFALALAILFGLIAVAGAMPAAAITMLLHNDAFCGHRCASSSLDLSTVLEVDACINGCALGRGGEFAVVASCLWLLVLLLVGTVAAISVVAAMPSVSPSLSRRKWWIDFCLPLAIQLEPLYPQTLLIQHEHRQQLLHKQ